MTEIRKITQEGEEEILSHYRVNKDKYGREIAVPVVDVRDGLSYRMMAMQMIKSNNRSKYINYNQYHQSKKHANKYDPSM
jgi:hypothetical protein